MWSQKPEIARKWAKEGKGYIKRKKKPSKRHYSNQAIKSSAGTLHAFVINSKSVGGVGTLYDSVGTSATIVAAIDTTISTTAFIYDAIFSTGITFAWGGNTGGDVTITWR